MTTMTSQLSRLLLAAVLLLGAIPVAAAPQAAGDLTIDYGAPFKESPEAADKQFKMSGPEAPRVTKRFQVFLAGPADGINQIQVNRIELASSFDGPVNLDGAAGLAIQNINTLAGMKGERHSIVAARAAGFEARRSTMDALRYSGKVGLESVVFYDAKNRVMYQVICMFYRTGGSPSLDDDSLASSHASASRILGSIKVAR